MTMTNREESFMVKACAWYVAVATVLTRNSSTMSLICRRGSREVDGGW